MKFQTLIVFALFATSALGDVLVVFRDQVSGDYYYFDKSRNKKQWLPSETARAIETAESGIFSKHQNGKRFVIHICYTVKNKGSVKNGKSV